MTQKLDRKKREVMGRGRAKVLKNEIQVNRNRRLHSPSEVDPEFIFLTRGSGRAKKWDAGKLVSWCGKIPEAGVDLRSWRGGSSSLGQ